MSYSRWIHSEFYTYWLRGKGGRCRVAEKEEQVFMLHTGLLDAYEITYMEVKGYLVDRGALQDRFGLTDKETDELGFYMKQFISDVDKEFKDGGGL
jgi:hypothetical protein